MLYSVYYVPRSPSYVAPVLLYNTSFILPLLLLLPPNSKPVAMENTIESLKLAGAHVSV